MVELDLYEEILAAPGAQLPALAFTLNVGLDDLLADGAEATNGFPSIAFIIVATILLH